MGSEVMCKHFCQYSGFSNDVSWVQPIVGDIIWWKTSNICDLHLSPLNYTEPPACVQLEKLRGSTMILYIL